VTGVGAIDPGAMRGRPVLVTGSGGFLGSAVTGRLVELGAEVRGLAGPVGETALLRPAPPGVRVAHGEIDDGALLASLLEGVDCVFHLAGPPSVAESFAAPARYFRIHAAGTAALLERCAEAGVRRLVHVSSAEVYAPPAPAAASKRAPVGEDHPRLPRSPYGVAKLAAELLLETWAASAGIQATIVRPFSVYGPGGSPRSLVGQLIGQLVRGEPIQVGDLRPVRDYCFVADAAEAIAACAAREGAPVRAYNLASGRGVSVAELAGALVAAAGRADLSIAERGGDRPAGAITLELVGDPTRAREELGFAAATSLEVGLALTWQASTADRD